ncbi:MAG TPA: glycine cleavage system protein GcvH [Sulfurospirillum arcachonense]|nr:glycine cleavage system protein GcvH [Sulfurospirillum arcachonense]HIP45553.1 glycine cleavage system protein GcvH [Sulfurospirillum arcachonense]
MIKKYSNEHEWAILDGEVASIGLSAYAVEQLGDITFVELPEIGAEADKDDSIAFIESVKAASDIYTPVGGEVVEANEELENKPELLNEAAETTWIFKLKVSDASEFDTLMDEAGYKAYIETL